MTASDGWCHGKVLNRNSLNLLLVKQWAPARRGFKSYLKTSAGDRFSTKQASYHRKGSHSQTSWANRKWQWEPAKHQIREFGEHVTRRGQDFGGDFMENGSNWSSGGSILFKRSIKGSRLSTFFWIRPNMADMSAIFWICSECLSNFLLLSRRADIMDVTSESIYRGLEKWKIWKNEGTENKMEWRVGLELVRKLMLYYTSFSGDTSLVYRHILHLLP